MDTSLLGQLAALPEMEATEMKALWKRLYLPQPIDSETASIIAQQLAAHLDLLFSGSTIEICLEMVYTLRYDNHHTR